MDRRRLVRLAGIAEALIGLGLGLSALDAGFVVIGTPALVLLGGLQTALSAALLVVVSRVVHPRLAPIAIILLATAVATGLIALGLLIRGPFLAVGILGCACGVMVIAIRLSAAILGGNDSARSPSGGPGGGAPASIGDRSL
jgi:hypothetical protein